jgi:hypothetical protein
MKLFLTAAFVTLTASAAISRPVNLPPGDIDRAAIMDAIREGTGSDAVFKVEFIRIDRTASPQLAYAEVRPSDRRSPGFRGWALLTLHSPPAGHVWKLIAGIDERHDSACKDVVSEAEAVWDVVSRRGAISLLGPKVLRRRGIHSARLEANGRDMPWLGICSGRIVPRQ